MTSSPRVGVLALQGDVAEHVAAFAALGLPVSTVRTPDDLAVVDALALPGGESTTMSRLLEVFGLVGPLRERLAGGLPCFATCAGMILLSRGIEAGRPGQLAFGVLDLTVRRNGYGRQVESFEADLDITGLEGGPFRAVFIRAPLVESVGPHATVLASLDGHAVAVEQGPHLAFAFHPEMTGDLRLHRRFVERLSGAS